jgi:fructose-1,6-bisphosphatase class II
VERNLALEVVRVTEAAALAAARLMGRGDNVAADQAAVTAMRSMLGDVQFKGRIVIGEGERDEAPMLFIGEEVGAADNPRVDIAVDPLEGTSIVATGGANALAVIAIAEEGGFLHAPDTYMQKIAVGPEARGVVDITKSPLENLRRIAKAKQANLEDLCVVILDRPRHRELIEEVRAAGARIKLIGDGDVAGAIATAKAESGVDVLMGIGGAPEGILAAAALKCLGGDFQGILKYRNREEAERAKAMGNGDVNKVYGLNDLARGDVMFAATGVTFGDFLQGVRFFSGGARTQSIVMRSRTRTIRYINTIHAFDFKPKHDG